MTRLGRAWAVVGLIVPLALLVCGVFYYFDGQYARAACFLAMVLITHSGGEKE